MFPGSGETERSDGLKVRWPGCPFVLDGGRHRDHGWPPRWSRRTHTLHIIMIPAGCSKVWKDIWHPPGQPTMRLSNSDAWK
jgi:hypothetical protein